MKNPIKFNIIKKISIDDTPFKIIIYVCKNENSIFIENLETGKCIKTTSYDLGKYIKLKNCESDWIRAFDNSYIRYHLNIPEFFMPLYEEKNKFVFLTFDIISYLCPKFCYQERYDSINGKLMYIVTNNKIKKDEDETYYEIFKNVKDFETENFQLEMEIKKDLNFIDSKYNPVKFPKIQCKLPLFQIYASLSNQINYNTHQKSIGFNYNQDLTVIKIGNTFYRFPYGNVDNNDQMCLGKKSTKTSENIQLPIKETAFFELISTNFTGDYTPHLRFNERVPILLDIDLIREKINNNNFDISFVDCLFYLSQCKTIEEINLKLFVLSPNVPKYIMDFEKILDSSNLNEYEYKQLENNIHRSNED